MLCFYCCIIKGRSFLRKFSLSLQSALESVFGNISKNSLWLSVTHEVGSIFVPTRVCSVNSNLMYFGGLNSLNTQSFLKEIRKSAKCLASFVVE